jgi:hypothetical protein
MSDFIIGISALSRTLHCNQPTKENEMKMMTELKTVHFNGKESNVNELSTEEIQTLIERVNRDAHQVLTDRFTDWAVSNGIDARAIKQKKSDDRSFFALLPDFGGMAVSSITFLARNPDRNWLTYGYSTKELLEPNEHDDEWSKPDYSIRVKGYKLTSQGLPSQADSEKVGTWMCYWEQHGETHFESSAMRDERERKERALRNRSETMRKDVIEVFGNSVAEKFDSMTPEDQTAFWGLALKNAPAKEVVSENSQAIEDARIKADRRADEQSTIA